MQIGLQDIYELDIPHEVGNYLITKSWNPSLALFKSLTDSTFSSYSLSIIPLFLLMGQFAGLGGMSSQLFNTAIQQNVQVDCDCSVISCSRR